MTEPLNDVQRGIAPRPLPGGALTAGAAVTACMAAGMAGGPIPAPVRMIVAVGALVFWPGAMLLRHFLVDREVEWPGRVAYSFVLGLLPGGLLALAAHAFRFDPGVGLWLLPLLGFALALAAPVRPALPHPRGTLPWLLATAWAIVVAAVLGSLGAPLVTDADSLDHVATVRRIEDTRVAFPTDAFFVDAGTHGADPRKGTYHVVLAVLCRAARVDPVTLWRFLPLLLVPVFVLAVAALTYALSRSRMAAVVAAFLFPFVYAGGPGGTELREAVYSTRVGEMAALLATAALVRHVEEGGKRRLGLFWATALSALFVHVWYALWFALAFGVYALATMLAAGTKERARRFGLAFGGLLVLALPYLAFRALQAYGPQNVIHTEPQGLLYLSAKLFTVDPRAVWTWHGPWLLVALCALPWFWSRRKQSTGAIFLATVTPAVLLVILDPLVLPLVQAKLGYLTMRLIWIAPVIPACAVVITRLCEVVIREGGRRRALALAGLAPCAVFLLPPVHQFTTLVTQRAELRAAEAGRSAAPWRDVLEFLATRLPGAQVIAADPVTSYSIPAYTGKRVMAFFDQHSSPNDPRALERILDARAIFSPYVPLARTVELLRAYRVDALVLNERFERPPATDYWSPTPGLAAATRAKFGARPDLFRAVYDRAGATVYALTPAARTGPLPDGAPAPRPFVAAADSSGGPGPWPDGAFVLRSALLQSAALAPDDTLRLTTFWSLAGPPPPAGSYAVYVRLDAKAEPRAPLWPDAWDKPYRKLVERVSGRRYRLRTAHRPLDGAFGPDEWRAGEIVADTTRLVVPPDLAPGRYEVGVALVRTPHYPNTQLGDYLHDHDLFSGPVVAEVTIGPRARAAR